MTNKIMFPYAIYKENNEIVSAIEVKNGKECNCICFTCRQNMIAINNPENKQKPHFRHDSNSDCAVSYESFIHWFTKEVFRNIDILYIPNIHPEKVKSKIDKVLNTLFNENKTPKKLRELIIDELMENISALDKITIQNVSIEESFKSEYGDVRVDVVLRFKNINNDDRILFIEPFFSNQIDYKKLLKIKSLNVSTISINLMDFVANKSHLFDRKDLRAFLVNNIKSKNWEHYNFDNFITNKRIEIIKKRLLSNAEGIQAHHLIMNDIKIIYKDIEKLETQRNSLQRKLALLNNDVRIKYESIDQIKFK